MHFKVRNVFNVSKALVGLQCAVSPLGAAKSSTLGLLKQCVCPTLMAAIPKSRVARKKLPLAAGQKKEESKMRRRLEDLKATGQKKDREVGVTPITTVLNSFW